MYSYSTENTCTTKRPLPQYFVIVTGTRTNRKYNRSETLVGNRESTSCVLHFKIIVKTLHMHCLILQSDSVQVDKRAT